MYILMDVWFFNVVVLCGNMKGPCLLKVPIKCGEIHKAAWFSIQITAHSGILWSLIHLLLKKEAATNERPFRSA